jgi:hypothetical protein
MNRAENIMFVLDRADKEGLIRSRDSARVYKQLAGFLNSGLTASEIDTSPAVEQLWKEVGRKWGSR